MSKNYLKKILTSKEKLKGALGTEQEAFREFLSGSWKVEEGITKERIINFSPLENEVQENYPISAVPLLVADGNGTSKSRSETYFYVSDNDDFAPKIDEKISPEDASLVASVISEEGKDLSDTILYCPETNRYYLHGSNNEIVLSGFKNFDYKKFSFRLLNTAAKIFFVMPKNSTEYTVLTLNMEYGIKKHSFVNGDLIAEIENPEKIKAIVMKSSKYFDFIPLNQAEILIPKALTESKFELLIY